MNWENKFSHEIIKRGESYYESSLIRDFKVDDVTVSAKVLGSKIYNVIITKDGDKLHLSCDCPHFKSGYNCKHLVAVLMELEEYELNNPFFGFSLHVRSDSELIGLNTEITKFFAMYSYKARYIENSEDIENLTSIKRFIEIAINMLNEDSTNSGIDVSWLLLSKLSNLITYDLIMDEEIANLLKLLLVTLFNKDLDKDNFWLKITSFYLDFPAANINDFFLEFLTLIDQNEIKNWLIYLFESFKVNKKLINDYQVDFYFEVLNKYLPAEIEMFLVLILIVKPFDLSNYLDTIFLKIDDENELVSIIKSLLTNIKMNNKSKLKLNNELVRIYLKNNEITKLKNHYQVLFKKELNPQLILDYIKLFPSDEEATYNIVRTELAQKELSDELVAIYLELKLHQDLINRFYGYDEVLFIINYQSELIKIAKNEYFDYCLHYLTQYPTNRNNRNVLEFVEQIYQILNTNDVNGEHIRIINRNWLNQAHRFPELAKIVLK